MMARMRAAVWNPERRRPYGRKAAARCERRTGALLRGGVVAALVLIVWFVAIGVERPAVLSASAAEQAAAPASEQAGKAKPEANPEANPEAKPEAKQPAGPEFTAAEVKFFEQEVEPILKARCLKCHGGEEKVRGEFRITSRSAVLRGGELGPAVSLDKPDESLLLKAVLYEDLEMPPSGKLPAAEIAVLRKWVQSKLPWTPGVEDEPVPEKPQGVVVDDKAKSYWAYQPIKRPAVPEVQSRESVRNPIDAFLLAKLEAAGLRPNGPADPVALVRRATYDLTGLPPSPADVDAFAARPTAEAYEALIDRLLDSPQYGEKWGRHWLDLVRYAETHGYERDSAKPFAWRYRDYVIQSFNDDKPYDRFLTEQLAGDELDDSTTETLIATGYYRLGIWDDEPADRPLAKYDVLDGVLSTTGQVMLGMSINCVRCHTHKKDPLPHRDYYRLLAFFQNVTDMNVANLRKIATDEQRAEFEAEQRKRQAEEGRDYAELYGLQQRLKSELGRRGAAGADAVDSAATSDLIDLRYKFYRDTWDHMPDFDAIKAEAEGEVADGYVNLEPASRREAIGLVFTGRLKVPAAGDYVFEVEATEGVRLRVGDRTVVDRPQRGTHRGDGKLRLEPGSVPVRVEFFNTDKKPRLNLSWRSEQMPRRSLSEPAGGAAGRPLLADSRQQGRVWSYTTQKPAEGWQAAAFDDAAWMRGEGGFGQRATPGAVVRTAWNSTDIWMRTKFQVDKLPRQLALSIHHDEDVEVYLNGRQVFSATGYLREYERRALDADALKQLVVGENVLAVHCRQTGGGQYVDVGLEDGRGVTTLADLVKRHGEEIWGREGLRRYEALTAKLEAARKEKPLEPGFEVMCVEERGSDPTHVLLRGDPGSRGDRVEPGVPEVLGPVDFSALADPNARRPGGTSGRRLALARWIVSRDNQLTARVMANRLWQYHFGRGIVATPNDFGQLGELPTHPELLDWLASELVDGGWKLKRMHKLIMLSAAYQRSSQGAAEPLEKDPANQLWWRYPMRRLAAEEVRDSILAVSGRLNLKAGGPSVYPPIPKEVLAGQSRPGAGWGNSPPEEASRRTIYVHVKRSLILPILATFDVADTDSSCPVRYTTTVPTQALGMLNGEFSHQQAAFLAERLRREAPQDPAAQVRLAVRLTTGRTPTDEEVRADLQFLERLRVEQGLSPETALMQYCLLAINTNEFLYLD